MHDVIVDLRADSPTFRQWTAVELSADNRRALYVPEGFAHGFVTLTDGAELVYQMSAPHQRRGARGTMERSGVRYRVAGRAGRDLGAGCELRRIRRRPVTTAQRVLVTGGRGFLGSHVLRALLASDREVAVLTRSHSVTPVAGDDAHKVSVITVSLQDREQLRHRIAEWRPDACIHLAWYAEPGRYLESPENLSALDGTLALLQALIDVGCATVAMAGSCAEYDTDQGWLTEDTPLRPLTIYAASKAAGSMLVQQLAKDTATSVAWARIFYPYGPFEDRRRAVPALIASLLEDRRFAASSGDQVRDYVYAKDVADAFVTLIDQRASGAFNVASGVPITIRQLMETIGDQLGRRDLIDFGAAPPRAWEPRFIAGKTDRLRSLGWSPRYTLDRGLEETIAWWREHHR